jgi:hypothetical protein
MRFPPTTALEVDSDLTPLGAIGVPETGVTTITHIIGCR